MHQKCIKFLYWATKKKEILFFVKLISNQFCLINSMLGLTVHNFNSIKNDIIHINFLIKILLNSWLEKHFQLTRDTVFFLVRLFVLVHLVLMVINPREKFPQDQEFDWLTFVFFFLEISVL